MKNVIVAFVGDNPDALFVGIREFPTERIILLSSEKNMGLADKLKKDLDRFQIKVQVKKLENDQWESMFQAISEVKNLEKEENLLVNVATGDRDAQCAATSAAYVNGIKAFSVNKGQVMMLPILKFSYYSTLTPKKLDILKIIYNASDCCASLDELSKRTKMSLPLISYHMNGNLKSEGLKDLGLVETTDEKGRTKIKLSLLGKLLMKGYIS